LTAGQGSDALALGGRLSAPDNPTRQIGSVKQNGRRVAPTAGLRLRRDGSGDLQIIRRRLAGPAIGDDVIGELLTS
jgi:hypothetical protein